LTEIAKTNEQIVAYLVGDIAELIPVRESLDLNDSFGDYLDGIISRSQNILRMMGIPEELIPQNGDC
jgi:phosphoribosylformylglycinamidine (FGAM) synthase-like amidotransferase family enzyme